MSWGAVALAGAAVVGSAMSKSSADKATRSADNAAAAELAFNQQRYDDWKEVYGPIQDNLANYYSSITPDMYEVQGLEAFNKEFEIQQQRLDETLAQRGIADSGIAAQLDLQQELGAAESRAKIRMSSPALAAEEQSRFLQIGLGQNPANSVAATLGNQAVLKAQNANQQQQVAGQAIGTAITEIGNAAGALGDYYGGSNNG